MQISPAQLACRPHWRSIPWSIRARILREFHRHPGSVDHLAAVGDGIRFLRAMVVARVVDELEDGPTDPLEARAGGRT